jgi:hypothetical protein
MNSHKKHTEKGRAPKQEVWKLETKNHRQGETKGERGLRGQREDAQDGSGRSRPRDAQKEILAKKGSQSKRQRLLQRNETQRPA